MKEVLRKKPRFNYPDQTGDAITQRYRKAKCEGIKYEGIIATIKANKPTGDATKEDIERAALAVYNEDARVRDLYTYLRDYSVRPGPEFPFKEALFYMRQTNTWAYIILSRRSRTSQPGAGRKENAGQGGPRDGVNGPFSHDEGHRKFGGVENASSYGLNRLKEEIFRRPSSTKRLLKISSQVAALHKGADGIEKLARAAQKRTKMAEEMGKVQKQQSIIALFSMPARIHAKFKSLRRFHRLRVWLC